MEFKLNNYHRNISSEDFLKDVKEVASRLEKNTLTTMEYDKYGQYHHDTLRKRFGSWKNVLNLAGLNTEKHNFYVSDQEYILDIQRVAHLLKKRTVTIIQYQKYGKYDASIFSKRCGSWSKVLLVAGLEPTGHHPKVTNQDLIEEIERIWIKLGRQPTTTDIKNGVSKYSLNTYARHFGGWRNALQAFIEYVSDENTTNTDRKEKLDESDESYSDAQELISEKSRKTRRDINLRLRFRVMQRDNFKCCICGASPANDPTVVLHIDHIIPWSKGGETIMENLQTLCSKCNLGKSNLI